MCRQILAKIGNMKYENWFRGGGVHTRGLADMAKRTEAFLRSVVIELVK
jgi:hypothetical protein